MSLATLLPARPRICPRAGNAARGIGGLGAEAASRVLNSGVGLGAVVHGRSLSAGDTDIMGRFDSRSTTKIRQRKAQAKKKADKDSKKDAKKK